MQMLFQIQIVSASDYGSETTAFGVPCQFRQKHLDQYERTISKSSKQIDCIVPHEVWTSKQRCGHRRFRYIVAIDDLS